MTCLSSHSYIPRCYWQEVNSLGYSRELFKDPEFKYRVIVDEATQALDPETLIPIMGAE